MRCARLGALQLATWLAVTTPSGASVIDPRGGIDFGFTIVTVQSIPDSGSIAFRPRDSEFPSNDADSTTVGAWRIAPNELSISIDFELGPDMSQPGFMIARTRGLTFRVDAEADYRLSGSLDFGNGIVQSLEWRALLSARPVSSAGPVASLFTDAQIEEQVVAWRTTLGESGPGDGFRLHDGALSGKLFPDTVYSLTFLVALGGIQSAGDTPRVSARYAIAVVPEPSVAILVGLGLVMLTALRSR